MKRMNRNILTALGIASLVSVTAMSGIPAVHADETKSNEQAGQDYPCGPREGMGYRRNMDGRGYMGQGYMGRGQMGQGYMGRGDMGWQDGEGNWRRGMNPDRGRGMGGQGFMERFGAIDENDDDRIGADEAASQRESVFLAMDADDNGELTMEEYMTVRMGPGPRREGGNEARQNQRQQAKSERFPKMDTDGSGTVSKAEWMLAGQERYQSADVNGDGIVTPWEFRSLHRRD